jgi:hypothetical protein
MIGARRYSPPSLVTSGWSHPQRLAYVNRGCVYRAIVYINRLSVSKRICFHTLLVKPNRYLDGAAIN